MWEFWGVLSVCVTGDGGGYRSWVLWVGGGVGVLVLVWLWVQLGGEVGEGSWQEERKKKAWGKKERTRKRRREKKRKKRGIVGWLG